MDSGLNQDVKQIIETCRETLELADKLKEEMKAWGDFHAER